MTNMTAETHEPSVNITLRPLEGCLVLDIEATQFTYPYTAVLKTEIQSLIEKGHRHFILNLASVQMVDSFGLATILSVLKVIREAKGNLALCGLNETVIRLVKITHLHNVLETWDSDTQAAYYLTHS